MANYGCNCNGNVAGTTDTNCNYNCNCNCNCQNNDNAGVGGTSTCNGCCNGCCNGGCGCQSVTATNCGNTAVASTLGTNTSEHLLIIIAIAVLLLSLFCQN